MPRSERRVRIRRSQDDATSVGAQGNEREWMLWTVGGAGASLLAAYCIAKYGFGIDPAKAIFGAS